jgi:hypothetical protein
LVMHYRKVSKHPRTSETTATVATVAIHEVRSTSMVARTKERRRPEGDGPAGFITVGSPLKGELLRVMAAGEPSRSKAGMGPGRGERRGKGEARGEANGDPSGETRGVRRGETREGPGEAREGPGEAREGPGEAREGPGEAREGPGEAKGEARGDPGGGSKCMGGWGCKSQTVGGREYMTSRLRGHVGNGGRPDILERGSRPRGVSVVEPTNEIRSVLKVRGRLPTSAKNSLSREILARSLENVVTKLISQISVGSRAQRYNTASRETHFGNAPTREISEVSDELWILRAAIGRL